MKYSIYILLAAVITLSSCKYEDGPKLSLRSKKARAVNTWYIDKMYEEGVDKTDAYKNMYVNYKLEIKDDNNYTINYRPFNIGEYNEKGTWKFSGDKQNIIFTPANTTQENSFKILRLKNNEAWVKNTIDGKQVEWHLKD